MKTFRGPLYRLKISGYEGELDITRSPLGQYVDRSKLAARALSPNFSKVRRRSTIHSESSKQQLPKLVEAANRANSLTDEPLGNSILDWAERAFELCQTSCELRYQNNKSDGIETRHSTGTPGMLSLGFIQADTTIIVGPLVESVDRNPETGEKLSIYTIELRFQCGLAIYPKFYILGHALESERDRWYRTMLAIINNKVTLQRGWREYYLHNLRSDQDKTEEWLKNRAGELAVRMNMLARRKARLQNGKVLQDVPKIFEKFSEECPDWSPGIGDVQDLASFIPGVIPRVMDASHIVEALGDLGLELSSKVAKRVLDEVRKNPPCVDFPDKIDLRRFELIFRSCCVEFLVSPSEEMKQNLLRIMQNSQNPFLSLLSSAEQKYLIEGKDADGKNFCTCKSYTKDTVLVQQGDEGDSMFIIIEGNLSVVVTFGAGSATVQKEVAVLPAGSVMGEMSLVLGKPRSATCIVKSESASVAEIAKNAMVRLLEDRPSLARQLEDMVHRRDAANYLNAGKTADAMALYRQRGTAAAGHATTVAKDGKGGGADGGGADGAGRRNLRADGTMGPRAPSRIQSRTAKMPPRRAATSQGMLPPVGGLPYNTGNDSDPGMGPRIKSGRWVKCRGIYVFVVD